MLQRDYDEDTVIFKKAAMAERSSYHHPVNNYANWSSPSLSKNSVRSSSQSDSHTNSSPVSYNTSVTMLPVFAGTVHSTFAAIHGYHQSEGSSSLENQQHERDASLFPKSGGIVQPASAHKHYQSERGSSLENQSYEFSESAGTSHLAIGNASGYRSERGSPLENRQYDRDVNRFPESAGASQFRSDSTHGYTLENRQGKNHAYPPQFSENHLALHSDTTQPRHHSSDGHYQPVFLPKGKPPISSEHVRSVRKQDNSITSEDVDVEPPVFNNRFTRMKLKRESLVRTKLGFSEFFSLNSHLMLKDCWEKEIVPRTRQEEAPCVAQRYETRAENSSLAENPNRDSDDIVFLGEVKALPHRYEINSVKEERLSSCSLDIDGEVRERTPHQKRTEQLDTSKYCSENQIHQRDVEQRDQLIVSNPVSSISQCQDVSNRNACIDGVQETSKIILHQEKLTIHETPNTLERQKRRNTSFSTVDEKAKRRCRRYLVSGSCAKGSDCKFLHILPKDDNVLCKNYEAGNCQRSAEECRYIHNEQTSVSSEENNVDDEKKSAADKSQSSVLSEETPVTKSKYSTIDDKSRNRCRRYLASRSCAKGSDCKYLHTLPKDDNVLCKDFEDGNCPRTAEKCRYKHNKTSNESEENYKGIDADVNKEKCSITNKKSIPAGCLGSLLSILRKPQNPVIENVNPQGGRKSVAPQNNKVFLQSPSNPPGIKLSRPRPVGAPRRRLSYDGDSLPSTMDPKATAKSSNSQKPENYSFKGKSNHAITEDAKQPLLTSRGKVTEIGVQQKSNSVNLLSVLPLNVDSQKIKERSRSNTTSIVNQANYISARHSETHSKDLKKSEYQSAVKETSETIQNSAQSKLFDSGNNVQVLKSTNSVSSIRSKNIETQDNRNDQLQSTKKLKPVKSSQDESKVKETVLGTEANQKNEKLSKHRNMYEEKSLARKKEQDTEKNKLDNTENFSPVLLNKNHNHNSKHDKIGEGTSKKTTIRKEMEVSPLKIDRLKDSKTKSSKDDQMIRKEEKTKRKPMIGEERNASLSDTVDRLKDSENDQKIRKEEKKKSMTSIPKTREKGLEKNGADSITEEQVKEKNKMKDVSNRKRVAKEILGETDKKEKTKDGKKYDGKHEKQAEKKKEASIDKKNKNHDHNSKKIDVKKTKDRSIEGSYEIVSKDTTAEYSTLATKIKLNRIDSVGNNSKNKEIVSKSSRSKSKDKASKRYSRIKRIFDSSSEDDGDGGIGEASKPKKVKISEIENHVKEMSRSRKEENVDAISKKDNNTPIKSAKQSRSDNGSSCKKPDLKSISRPGRLNSISEDVSDNVIDTPGKIKSHTKVKGKNIELNTPKEVRVHEKRNKSEKEKSDASKKHKSHKDTESEKRRPSSRDLSSNKDRKRNDIRKLNGCNNIERTNVVAVDTEIPDLESRLDGKKAVAKEKISELTHSDTENKVYWNSTTETDNSHRKRKGDDSSIGQTNSSSRSRDYKSKRRKSEVLEEEHALQSPKTETIEVDHSLLIPGGNNFQVGKILSPTAHDTVKRRISDVMSNSLESEGDGNMHIDRKPSICEKGNVLSDELPFKTEEFESETELSEDDDILILMSPDKGGFPLLSMTPRKELLEIMSRTIGFKRETTTEDGVNDLYSSFKKMYATMTSCKVLENDESDKYILMEGHLRIFITYVCLGDDEGKRVKDSLLVHWTKEPNLRAYKKKISYST